MKAVMLAAGLGRRLYGDHGDQSSKALLTFDGKTLLRRHIEFLRDSRISELVLVVGNRRDAVIAEAEAVAGPGFVRALYNPAFEDGPILSLWTARDVMAGEESILFMDADVLYHRRLLDALVDSPDENCFLIDRAIELGDDPVRLCLRDGVPVDFGKRIEGEFDLVGEWPGFLKMSPRIARRVAEAADERVRRGETTITYEVAMRDVLVDEPAGTFGCEDITGVPWIEIDYPSDLLRAERHILPRILAMSDEGTLEAAGSAAARYRTGS